MDRGLEITSFSPARRGGGRAGQKGLKKERKKDAGSEEAEAERVKDGEVGQVRSDVDSDAAEIRPRAEGGRLTGGDVHRTWGGRVDYEAKWGERQTHTRPSRHIFSCGEAEPLNQPFLVSQKNSGPGLSPRSRV
ncbi:glutamate receptor 1 [Sarotherodon galilaeus]